ncbi:hypothetical protein [Methylogaea oryzae]|uniref:hypothetical protein n=1 Tax=Methylogaea oryzae TaxID=1295382 RepID=UPI0012E1C6C6|nr:hypothetical protein [Methylogaea oryzae]
MDERRFDGAWRYGLSVAEIAPSLPLKPIYPPMNLTSITLAKIAKKLTGRDGEDPSFARFFALIQQVEKSCFKKTFVLATFRSIPPSRASLGLAAEPTVLSTASSTVFVDE